jgi:hypothetical protein
MRLRHLLLTAALLLAVAAPAAAQDGNATVTVVHGIPGATVDVWVNGEATLEGFAPGTITDPLSLPAGDYEIAVYEAGADPESADAIIEASVSLPGGANASAVAHLTEAGEPTLTPFVHDTSAIAAGDARITVRHTAAAPAVDVRAGGEPVFSGLANPDEESADLPAGSVEADVVLAGESDPVLGPATLNLAEGTATIVYAIGSAEDGSLDLLVQTISGLGSTPTAVESGTGGQAAASGLSVWALAGLALGGAVTLASGVALARARR